MRWSTSGTGEGARVLVACAQYAVRDGDGEENLRRSLAWISAAARAGAVALAPRAADTQQ